MGRWSYSSRDTVEECRTVDINFLNKYGYLKNSRSGIITWTNSSGKENSIGVQSLVGEEPISMIFTYTITKSSGEKEDLNYKTELTKTLCNFGNFRYWFKCGGIVNGVYCGQRVSKLYKAPAGKYFLCRHCHNLSYDLRRSKNSSIYESDRIDKKLNKIKHKMGKKGIHAITRERLLKKYQQLEWDLEDAYSLSAYKFVMKTEKLIGKLKK